MIVKARPLKRHNLYMTTEKEHLYANVNYLLDHFLFYIMSLEKNGAIFRLLRGFLLILLFHRVFLVKN